MICLRMRKTSPGGLRSQFSRIHYYQNNWLQVKESQYLISTYNWILTPILNWTCSVVTISHFNARLPVRDQPVWCADPNTHLTHQLEKDVGCKVLQFITRWRSRNSLVTKPYGVQTQYKFRGYVTRWEGVRHPPCPVKSVF